jgi:hypothetical protein
MDKSQMKELIESVLPNAKVDVYDTVTGDVTPDTVPTINLKTQSGIWDDGEPYPEIPAATLDRLRKYNLFDVDCNVIATSNERLKQNLLTAAEKNQHLLAGLEKNKHLLAEIEKNPDKKLYMYFYLDCQD